MELGYPLPPWQANLAACQTLRAFAGPMENGKPAAFDFPASITPILALATEHPTVTQAESLGPVAKYQRLPHSREANLNNV